MGAAACPALCQSPARPPPAGDAGWESARQKPAARQSPPAGRRSAPATKQGAPARKHPIPDPDRAASAPAARRSADRLHQAGSPPADCAAGAEPPPARWCCQKARACARRRQSPWRVRFAPGTARSSPAAADAHAAPWPTVAQYQKNRTDPQADCGSTRPLRRKGLSPRVPRLRAAGRFASAVAPAERACRR